MKKIHNPMFKTHCSHCFSGPFCQIFGDYFNQLSELNRSNVLHKSLTEGEFLFHDQELFTHFYIVQQGAFKTCSLTEDGREQIFSFFLSGDLIGLEAVGYGQYPFSAVALDKINEVCKLPAQELLSFMQQRPDMQQNLIRITSEQMQSMLSPPRNAHAKEKIASFLIHYATRYLRHEPANGDQFHLQMTRQDIGNYLGLTVETVSRTLTKFKKESLLWTQGKIIQIVNYKKLAKVAGF